MIALALMLAAQTIAAAATAPDAASAEIARLETRWGEAFVKRDYDFLERIVAPEFRLVGARDSGEHSVTQRAQWMKNSRAFAVRTFAVETVDVNRAGNTAVASVRGEWTVARSQGEVARPSRFFVTDTWVRRGRQWQVIHRYSHRLSTGSPSTTKK